MNKTAGDSVLEYIRYLYHTWSDTEIHSDLDAAKVDGAKLALSTCAFELHTRANGSRDFEAFKKWMEQR